MRFQPNLKNALIGAAVAVAAAFGCAKAACADGVPTLYAFSMDCCPYCDAMQPVLQRLATDGYAVEHRNVSADGGGRELAERCDVHRFPTFVVIENGQEIDRVAGVVSYDRLRLHLRQRDRHSTSAPTPKQTAGRQPSPAWRYEAPLAHRAAVVRIYCQDDSRTRSIGSGTLVRWAGRVMVLTARHVVADAKSIVVELATGKRYYGSILKCDATWDCAVLELQGAPGDLPAVEVQLGQAAMLHDGDRLESCGYGPDARLAVNSGRFLGYRRSEKTPNGPDDWIEISGHARPGDSGGPIFNSRGRVVGVLWGTNGEVVVGVQAGRLHLLLDAATTPAVERKIIERKSFVLTSYEIERHPTAPKADETGDCPNGCQNGSCARPILPGPLPYEPYVSEANSKNAGPLLPWRNETQRRDDAQDARIRALIELQERQARESAPKAEAAPSVDVKAAPAKKDEASPLVAGACILAAVGIAAALYFLTAKGS
jgi:thiol-disulfide isomerase/thioredoxin